ncbi:MAG: phage terminase large subunit family protein [Proteobacteria bacterium]|nr:phage terminase large subunit family protein [Pseudomonadota bacterium]
MSYSKALISCWNKCILTWKPAERLSLSEWADKYAYLSPESAHEPGKWKTLPYQKDILDAFTDLRVEKITMMKSARVGYTKILNQVEGYHIHHDPKSILMVQPTVEDAQGYSKEELAPMLRDTPVLQGLVAEAKSRDSSNTILKKSYPGGFLSLVGANSARGFRRISVPIVLFDEVDGYPPTAGQEGDQIKLGTKRAEWFWDKKIAIGSTPTTKEMSRVEKSFNESDKRFYFVPCPFCNEFQTIDFNQIKWPKGEPEKAALECKACKNLIPHSKKRWMIERGEWRATEKFNGHAGFFIWAGYSYAPNATWAKIAAEFDECYEDTERLKTFKNTTLGQTWEDEFEQPDWAELKARSEPYEMLTVPDGGMVLTAGVDVQDNRLAVLITAWGRGEESWVIYWTELFGNPGEQQVWTDLDKLLNRSYEHASGVRLHIISAAIDTGGHFTQEVYNYCRLRSPHVMAIKGASQSKRPVVGKPRPVDVSYHGVTIKKGVNLWQIGTDTAKSTISKRLNLLTPGPGYIHFPIGLPDEFFIQLTAEKRVTRYKDGYPVHYWVNTRPRNEASDCFNYAYAAAIRREITSEDWDVLEMNIKNSKNETIEKLKPEVPRVIKSNWMKR